MMTDDPTKRDASFQNSSVFDDIRADDHVLFMKASDNAYRRSIEFFSSVSAMRNTTQAVGFACWSRLNVQRKKPTEESANVVYGPTLGKFKMREYVRKSETNNTQFIAIHRPLRRWLSSFNESVNFPLEKDTGFFRVCFGGQFMTTVRQIARVDSPVKDWAPIVYSLSRGDNIEEGHYMERMWAGFLSPPIPQEELVELKRRFKNVRRQTTYKGLVILNREEGVEV
jgi:hypothetical protein